MRIEKITQLSKHPVIAIGGIDASNIGKVIENGAFGAAVVSAVHDHDPRKTAADLITEINRFLK